MEAIVNTKKTLLEMSNISSGYGQKKILSDLSLKLVEGDLTVIIGPNGAGKSTILKALFGLVPLWSGSMNINGVTIEKHSPLTSLENNVSFAPQSSRIFPGLTVKENLLIGQSLKFNATQRGDLDFVFELLPELKVLLARNAGKLSGGEQQMVNLGRCLSSKPKIILLDEPSHALSPQKSTLFFNQLKKINETGVSILMVEQKVKLALQVAKRVVGISLGRKVFEKSPTELTDEKNHLLSLFLK